MPPAARLTDAVSHPLPLVLTGPGSRTVLIGFLPAWKGILLAAGPGLMPAIREVPTR